MNSSQEGVQFVFPDGRVRSFSLNDILFSDAELEILRFVTSASQTILSVDLNVLFNLASIKCASDTSAIKNAWNTFLWTEAEHLPPELVQLKEWIRDEKTKLKYQMALQIHQITSHYNTSIPRCLTFVSEFYCANAKGVALTVYSRFFTLQTDRTSGMREFGFLLMSKGYAARTYEDALLDNNTLVYGDEQTPSKEWELYKPVLNAYYAMVGFLVRQNRLGTYSMCERSPSYKAKKRGRDIFYTCKELFVFFLEDAKKHHVEIIENKRLHVLWKHFFWRLVLNSTRETRPASIVFLPLT